MTSPGSQHCHGTVVPYGSALPPQSAIRGTCKIVTNPTRKFCSRPSMYHHRCNFMLSVGENAFKLCSSQRSVANRTIFKPLLTS